jgi:uncharacterized membrane protein (DUF485 family)
MEIVLLEKEAKYGSLHKTLQKVIVLKTVSVFLVYFLAINNFIFGQ